MLKISIVVPTYNEELNIKKLLEDTFFASYINDFGYEVLVVDDGNDNTAMIARRFGANVIQGQHKGLGQAIIDGINNAHNDIIVVMDADLSHNPYEISRLVNPIAYQGFDFVVGSRYVKGGDSSGWSRHRRLISQLSSKILAPFMGVKDINSGFFALHKRILEGVQLKPDSWKIMLEVLVRGKWVAMQEVPIKFIDRQYGQSKNNLRQIITQTKHTIKLLWDKYRFLKFGTVGAMFAGFHFGLLYFLTESGGLFYLLSAICSGIFTATLAYAINHRWTFQRAKIRHGWFKGWMEYISVCGVAELTYIGMLAFFTEIAHIWYIISAMMAVTINYPFKYLIVSKLVWKTKEKGMDRSDSSDFEWRAYFRANPLRKMWKRKITERIAEFVNSYPKGRILDFGCGSSPTVIFLKHNDYLGIDGNLSKVGYMKSKNLPECEFIKGDEKTMSWCDREYDTVLCIEVLEHLQNVDETIKALSERLKVGGRLIIATPNRKSLLWKFVEKAQRHLQPTYHTSQHVKLYSSDMINNLCVKNHLWFLKKDSVALGMDMILYYKKMICVGSD